MKAEAKQKIVEKHLTEKRKLASDVNARMEKHGKNIDEIKSKYEQIFLFLSATECFDNDVNNEEMVRSVFA